MKIVAHSNISVVVSTSLLQNTNKETSCHYFLRNRTKSSLLLLSKLLESRIRVTRIVPSCIDSAMFVSRMTRIMRSMCCSNNVLHHHSFTCQETFENLIVFITQTSYFRTTNTKYCLSKSSRS